jgi:putative transposase
MISSMSRKGDYWDNSVAESFFSTLKIKRIFDSIYRTREEARAEIIDCIEMFYNNKRRHSYLGCLSPNDFEKIAVLKKQLKKLSVLLDHIR